MKLVFNDYQAHERSAMATDEGRNMNISPTGVQDAPEPTAMPSPAGKAPAAAPPVAGGNNKRTAQQSAQEMPADKSKNRKCVEC